MKLLKILKVASVAIAVSTVLTTTVNAGEIASGTATMTIQNAFDFDQTVAMTFGTITAQQTIPTAVDSNSDAVRATFAGGTGNTTAGIRIKSDGTANEVIAGDNSSPTYVLISDGSPSAGTEVLTGTFDSAVREIVAGTPASFTVANAAPFTTLTVSDPSDAPLTRAGAPASESFVLDINLDDMTVVGGASDGSLVSVAQPQTDATGGVGLTVGGELRINPLYTGGVLGDGTYSGNYTIEISY